MSFLARANVSGMKKIENRAAKHLGQDKELIYVVTPVCEGSSGRPWGVHMSAVGEGGVYWGECIH